jgi:hypothetical protein
MHSEQWQALAAFAQAHLQALLTAAAIVVAFFFGYACG